MNDYHMIKDQELQDLMEIFSNYIAECKDGVDEAHLLRDWLYVPMGASLALMLQNGVEPERKWTSVDEVLDQMIGQLHLFKEVTAKLRKAELSGRPITPDQVHNETEH